MASIYVVFESSELVVIHDFQEISDDEIRTKGFSQEVTWIMIHGGSFQEYGNFPTQIQCLHMEASKQPDICNTAILLEANISTRASESEHREAVCNIRKVKESASASRISLNNPSEVHLEKRTEKSLRHFSSREGGQKSSTCLLATQPRALCEQMAATSLHPKISHCTRVRLKLHSSRLRFSSATLARFGSNQRAGTKL